MKKLICLLLTAILCLNIGTVTAFAGSDEIRARYLTSAETDAFKGYKITMISESSTVKKALVTVADNEMLIIRKGVTLRLYQGAAIDGAVYVQNGAKLLLSGGTLTISGSGSVVSDGTLSVGSKGVVSVSGGGEIFIGKKGRLKINKEDSLQFDRLANVICLGKNNSQNAMIGKKAVAAYVLENGKLTAVKKPAELLPTGTDYYPDFTYQISERLSTVSFLFDSGATLRVLRDSLGGSEKFAVIGNCNTAFVGMYTKKGNGGASYCRIYEIEGKDYIMDIKTGGMVLLEDDGTVSAANGKELTGALAKFSQKKSKSLGTLDDNRLGGEESSSAQMYLMPDGTVLAMEKESNPPLELLDAPKDTLDRLYQVYFFCCVD